MRFFDWRVPTLFLFLSVAGLLKGEQLLQVKAQAEPAVAGRLQAPAAIWLTPMHGGKAAAADVRSFTLLQKNKQFLPHLLVVPVGSMVRFPNADPFFHNVFSLFNGRRFDLGLYEAGSSKAVTFGQEGVSYIFCNIHPEMSAVVISLSTPYFAVLEAKGGFHIANVPADEYLLHVWVEGEDPDGSVAQPVRVAPGHTDLGMIRLPVVHPPVPHTNKYGRRYDTRDPAIY